MSIALVNPNLIVQRNDPFTTGIVYMPISMAYTSAALRQAGFDVQVVDAFAEKPRQARRKDNFLLLGLSVQEVLDRVARHSQAVFVYAINLTNHLSTVQLVQELKAARSELPIVVLENTQAVTAYALSHVAKEFFDAGADYVLTGEAERSAVDLAHAITQNDQARAHQVPGLVTPDYAVPQEKYLAEEELNALPYPAWDLFPLENYWNLRFAHGPQSSKRYLPLLTSRGCPYPCQFCVVPATNNQKWRARSAGRVVDEIAHYVKEYGVTEFHIEDLDPTISDERIRAMCQEILDRDLNVIWKIAAGTKVETLRDEATIDLMARAGCRYISISPETGSPTLLKAMRKPFDLDHAVRLVKRMNEVGIRSQACFVLGYPGETEEDRRLTWEMVHDLTRKGVDEVALFVVTPVPGSAIFDQFDGYENLSQLNFSPTWRKDYPEIARFRLRLYAHFLWWKLRYHPFKILRQPINFILRRFETKMEMVPYRAIVFRLLDQFAASQS